MASFSQLPSGNWRVQVRRAGLYKAATFTKKREAKDWASAIEGQAEHIAAGGFAPVPKGSTIGDLIDKYNETHAKTPGRTKAATLAMLKSDASAKSRSATSTRPCCGTSLINGWRTALVA